MKSGDDVTVSATATYNNANVGTGKAITVVYTLGGADAAKYKAPDNTVLQTGEITKKPLTLLTSTQTVAPKIYDGSTAATLLPGPFIISGLVGGDQVNITAEGTFADANAGSGKDVTVSYNLSGTAAANYSLASTTLQGNITPKQLTISNPTVTKVYDGTTTATITPGTVSGIVGQDDVQVSATGTYANANVGTEKTTTVSYQLSGAQAANYNAPQTIALPIGVITAAPITAITAIQGTPKEGEMLTAGTVSPSGATVTYQWQAKDSSASVYSTITNATASTYTPTMDQVGKVIRVVVTGNGNYKGSAASTPTATITPQ